MEGEVLEDDVAPKQRVKDLIRKDETRERQPGPVDLDLGANDLGRSMDDDLPSRSSALLRP